MHLLDQEDIAGLGIGEETEQLRPRELSAALVLDVLGRDGELLLPR
jgi:hypothetical protein